MNVFTLYYLVATILMLVVVWNYRQNLFALLLILLAFSGTIAYWIPRGTQMMNIITVLLSTYLFVRNKVWQIFPHMQYLMLSFIVFSLYFVCDNLLLHNDSLLFVFSQYSKYYVPFMSLLLFIYYARKDVIYLRTKYHISKRYVKRRTIYNFLIFF